MRYDLQVKSEIRRLFIDEGWTPHRIAKFYDNSPTAITIHSWSKRIDQFGKSWIDYRAEHQHNVYLKASPKALMDKIYDKLMIYVDMDVKSFTTKDADAMLKLLKSIQSLVDPKKNLVIILPALTEFMLFLRENYPDLARNEQLRNSINHFIQYVKGN